VSINLEIIPDEVAVTFGTVLEDVIDDADGIDDDVII
jgi:hypothetical protein